MVSPSLSHPEWKHCIPLPPGSSLSLPWCPSSAQWAMKSHHSTSSLAHGHHPSLGPQVTGGLEKQPLNLFFCPIELIFWSHILPGSFARSKYSVANPYPRKRKRKWRLEIQLKISTWLPTSEGFSHFNLQPAQVTPLTGPTLKYYLSLVPVFFFNRKEGLTVWGSLIPCICSKIINSLMNNYFIGSLISEALSCVWRIPAPLWSLGGK